MAKWVCLALAHQESAGKRLSMRTIPGNRSFRAVLLEAGQTTGSTKATDVGAQYRWMARTKGSKPTSASAHSTSTSATGR